MSTIIFTSFVIWKRKDHGIALLFLLLSFLNLRTIEFVSARSATTKTSLETGKLEGTVKTIMVGKDDIVDCVDIYKQPAFDHPLLKNHTLQMPSPMPCRISNESTQIDVLESLLKFEECPEGTVPIARKQNDFAPSTSRFHTPLIDHQLSDSPIHEHASVRLQTSKYYGADSRMNVWHPRVANEGEFSQAQTWLASDQGSSISVLEAGWQVRYNEPTRLFVYWTANGYRDGCYNLQCPGFVQTNRRFYPGIPLTTISQYGGKQYYIDIAIIQDKKSKDWKFLFGGQQLGYLPSAVVPKCVGGVQNIHFGGQILNKKVNGVHTRTEMGGGHFAYEGFGKGSFFSNLGYYNADGTRAEPVELHGIITNGKCYDVAIETMTKFYYGGPGFDKSICPY